MRIAPQPFEHLGPTPDRQEPREGDLIYDWNVRKRHWKLAQRPILLYDETLRDGLQGPSIVDPPLQDKKRILNLADALGIHYADLGLPGAGPRAREHVEALVRHIQARNLSIRPSCAARTHRNDIQPIVEISQATGMEIEVMAFLGASPIRQYVEDWKVGDLLGLCEEAIRFAVTEGLPVTFVTEDTARSRPQTLEPLFRRAIECGARRLCLCDTVGHATPDGVHNLIDFTLDVVESSGAEIGLDWHGHNDRGLALTNTLRAIEYGVDRVHGTALGIGERVGNAPLEQVLVNLKLLGEIDNDLSKLTLWCHTVSEATRWTIARNHPIMGRDAFRTATGVHAAAVIKAERKGDRWLADRVYSGIPAGQFGKEQLIEIGPMSGLSNVAYWAAKHGYDASQQLLQAILDAAKGSDRVLSDAEIHHLLEHFGRLLAERMQ